MGIPYFIQFSGFHIQNDEHFWVISTFSLLWIIFLWIYVYWFLCAYILVLLNIYLGIKLLTSSNSPCNFFRNFPAVLSSALFYVPKESRRVPVSPVSSSLTLVTVWMFILTLIVSGSCLWFWWSISKWLVMLKSFHVFLGHFCIFLEK